jgi:hypothetical protein
VGISGRQGVVITALSEEDEAMTSTDETLEPQPPALLPPRHPPAR